MVLRAIQDQFGRRPIVFARTVAGYPDRFGLTTNLVGQGMVRVLEPSPVAVNDTIQQSPELGLVNVPRSRELLEHVYHAHTAARYRPLGWIDVPSENIPATYAFIYQSLGAMLFQTQRAGSDEAPGRGRLDGEEHHLRAGGGPALGARPT